MKPTDFAAHLSDFLSKYLPVQRNARPNTIRSYSDTFSLFLRYCRDQRRIGPDTLEFAMVDVDLVVGFLEHLEKVRRCGKSTINQRLAALRSFFRYVQVDEPARMTQCQRILTTPSRRHPPPAVTYLTKEDLAAVLRAPDLSTSTGLRDAALLSLLYDTGARVQELADLTVEAVRFEAPAHVTLVGKGQKTRVVPLMEKTAALLSGYAKGRGLLRPERSMESLFQNRRGESLSRSGIRYILEKHVRKARASRKSLPAKISPHTLRHTKAMHLLQSGNSLVIIRDILGHSDIRTTEIYAKSDLEMRTEALRKAAPAAPTLVPPRPTGEGRLMALLRSLPHVSEGMLCGAQKTKTRNSPGEKGGNST